MSGYTILATNPLRVDSGYRLHRALPAVAGAALGAAIGGSHPVLSALLGSAIVKNAYDYATGETTAPEAAKNLRTHTVATIGALSMPFTPMIGYGIGLIADSAVFGATWKPAPSFADVRAGSATLHEGMQGPAVETLQQILNVNVDGKFGNETADAVRAFKAVYPDDFSNDVVSKSTLVNIEGARSRGESFSRTPTPTPRAQAAKAPTPYLAPASQAGTPALTLVPMTSPTVPTAGPGNFLSVMPTWQKAALGLGAASLLGAAAYLFLAKPSTVTA